VCEANSSPGFQGLESACGIDVPELVFLAMAKKFGLPVRHSQRWERAIENAARAVFTPLPTRSRSKSLPPPRAVAAPLMARARKARAKPA
jgi:gamma-F420-2:alpha-L-glutamate ligase